MPTISYHDGNGIFETCGGFLEQRRQVKEVSRIAQSEGLRKSPLRKRFEGEGMVLTYQHVYSRFEPNTSDLGPRGSYWSGLSIRLDSEVPNDKADRLAGRLEEFVRRNWDFKFPKLE